MTRRERIEEMLTANPNDGFLMFALAKEIEKQGNDEAALEAYQKLKDTDPDYVGLYFHLAKTLERLNREAEAWQTYTTGMSIAKKLGEQHAMNELAGARLELGDEEDFI
ncbi:MAG: tetratricopeptide repeat protein [Bacteroidota bacterium]